MLPVEWVMLSRWEHESGVVEFCVEYLADRTEIAAEDVSFESLADAERYAAQQFCLTPDDWRDAYPLLVEGKQEQWWLRLRPHLLWTKSSTQRCVLAAHGKQQRSP